MAAGQPAFQSDTGSLTSAVVCVENSAQLEKLVAQLGEIRLACICLVSTFRVHLGPTRAAEVEDLYVARLKQHAERVVVFRPGHVVRSPRRPRPLLALVPANLKNCFVEADELFATIENELQRPANETFASSRCWAVIAPGIREPASKTASRWRA